MRVIGGDLSNGEIAQLYQLDDQRWSGVWAGNLMDKDSTRSLIRKGYAENTGGSPSSLDRVYISQLGRVLIDAWKEMCEAANS